MNSEIDFDVETCSENYKKNIRSANYGDYVNKTTEESMIFIYEGKKYTIKFTLEYSFDFDNAFTHTHFSDFKSSRITPPNLMDEFIKYVKWSFVTCDRLSA